MKKEQPVTYIYYCDSEICNPNEAGYYGVKRGETCKRSEIPKLCTHCGAELIHETAFSPREKDRRAEADDNTIYHAFGNFSYEGVGSAKKEKVG